MLALFLPFSLWAQAGESVASIATPQTLAIKRGDTATQDLRVALKSGFHVNSDKPKDEFLIPLKLTWTGPLLTKKIVYPKPEEVKVGNDVLQRFYRRYSIFVTEICRVPAQVQAGMVLMEGKLITKPVTIRAANVWPRQQCACQ